MSCFYWSRLQALRCSWLDYTQFVWSFQVEDKGATLWQEGQASFEKQNPSASPVWSVCLKSEPFTSRLASSAVRLTALKCMDSALGQCQPRSRLTPARCQPLPLRTHSARAGPGAAGGAALHAGSPSLVSPSFPSKKQTLHPPPLFPAQSS